MCTGNTFWDQRVREVASASTPLSTDGGSLLEVPTHHTFYNTEDSNHLVLVTFGLCKNVDCRVVPNVVDDSFGK